MAVVATGGPEVVVVDLQRAAPRVRVALPVPATSVAVAADGTQAFAGAGAAVSAFPLDDGPAARAGEPAGAAPAGAGGAEPADEAVALRTSPDLGAPVTGLAGSPGGATLFVAAGRQLVLLDARDLRVLRASASAAWRSAWRARAAAGCSLSRCAVAASRSPPRPAACCAA